MPAPTTFKKEWFAFENGEEAPEHTDDFPKREERDPSLYHIEGFIPSDGDFVWLAINLGDETTAVRMLEAARRHLKAQSEEADGPRIDMIAQAALVGPNNEGIYSSIEGQPDQLFGL